MRTTNPFPTRFQRILYGIALTLALGLIANAALWAYFLVGYARPSVTYTTSPTPAHPSAVKTGQQVYFDISRCAKGRFPYTIDRFLTNDIVYSLPPMAGVTQKGCTTFTRMAFTVPAEIGAGTYHAEANVAITVDWLWFHRTDTQHILSTDFTIQGPTP